jgi:hypothetical protein
MTVSPYFLTANHCVGGSVTSWVIRFNFQATTCGGSTSQTYQTAIGTTLLASGAASDYALLRINGGVDIPNCLESLLRRLGLQHCNTDILLWYPPSFGRFEERSLLKIRLVR